MLDGGVYFSDLIYNLKPESWSGELIKILRLIF